MNINIGYAVILYFFMTFTSEVKQMWHMYKYVVKYPFRQDIQTNILKCHVKSYIMTLALYTLHTRV